MSNTKYSAVSIGNKYGKWTVIKSLPDRIYPSGNKKKMWLCQCDCGKIKEVFDCGLKNGTTTSCGKCNEIFEGYRFGRLTVLQKAPDYYNTKGKKGSRKWICKCDCGNIVSVFLGSLTSGKTLSCGCYNKENRKNITKLYNFYEIKGDKVYVYFGEKTTNAEDYFIIDRENLDKIKSIKWHKNHQGYVVNKSPQNIFLHRYLLNLEDLNLIVDHIDRNPLNNIISNLRITTQQNNCRNQQAKNYYYDKKRKKYGISFTLNYIHKFFGYFPTEKIAHSNAYKKRRELFGEYAWDWNLSEEESWEALHCKKN